MSERRYYLETERAIAELKAFAESLGAANNNLFWEALGEIEPGADRRPRPRTPEKSYHMLDFHDFLEYATSQAAAVGDLCVIPDNSVAYYDAYPGSTSEPLLDENAFGPLTILGVVLARYDPLFTICSLERVFLESEDNTTWGDQLLFLDLGQDATSPLEIGRWSVWPPTLDDPQWRYAASGDWGEKTYSHLHRELLQQGDYLVASKFSQKQQAAHRDTLFRQFGTGFELARLCLLLPSYFDFMYDVVVTEKRLVAHDHSTKVVQGRPRTKEVPIYRLVKSVRVTYEADQQAREQLDTKPRTWAAPAYRYSVAGHWRQLSHDWWRGHGPDGATELGRTWVHDYEKGRQGALDVELVTERDPEVVIKLKEPLSYGRDVVRSVEKTAPKPSVPLTAGETPSKEWMFKERQKLSSGLRYIVMKRDGFQCRLCGAAGVEGVRLEVDHIVPISRGGKTELDNLRTLCRDCNAGKSAS